MIENHNEIDYHSPMHIFFDTVDTVNQGYYTKDGKQIPLKLSAKEMTQAFVFLPNSDMHVSFDKTAFKTPTTSKCTFTCQRTDTLSMALRRAKTITSSKDRVLILNFANPYVPGGGILDGARAQEEDLCRKTTLYASLINNDAKPYYEYHRQRMDPYESDAMILSPHVEILKDRLYHYLDDTFVISALTCAAPILYQIRDEPSNEKQYQVLYQRIEAILRCAATYHYRHLVLGAFGCGAFGNNPYIVAKAFYDVITYFNYDNKSVDDYFSTIDFAILSTPRRPNYEIFCDTFKNKLDKG